MNNFTPDLSSVVKGDSETASEFARKMIIETIRQYAIHKGVTQAAIAEATGLRQSNVSRVLQGKYPPTLDTVLKIAGALEMRLELMMIHN